MKAYNYNTSDVISAILEENLPPHLLDIPFDQIRIPPEPEPEKPILAYKGRKPGYDDALKLLNDKKDIKEIKTFILDGMLVFHEAKPSLINFFSDNIQTNLMFMMMSMMIELMRLQYQSLIMVQTTF